jgi:hypothetical protein
MKRMRVFIVALAACLAPAAALAQAPTFNSTGLVVTTCGTLPTPFVAGRAGPFTVEAATGKLCDSGGGGGGGDATAANQVLQIAQETAFNTALGAMADAACATDNGTCSTIALIKRTNQRLTTINTTLGSPFQAGGSIGNTSFGATQATAANLNAQVVGPAASGAALSGNPVRIGLSDGTNAQNLLAAIALGDGVNGNNTAATGGFVWNGTTWDRMPGTTAGVTVRSPVAANFLATATLGAGSAIIGNVRIDQTTPGTTNNVTVSPLPRSARNFPGCSVTTSSAECLAASTAVTFLQVQNTGTANAIACRFGNTAALNSATSFQLASGQGASWGPNTGGVPTGALNCIAATGTTPLYVEWN